MFEQTRMLAIDIDRTTLTDDHRLLPDVIAAVRRARDAGLRVIPATARSPAGLRPVIEALHLDGPCVCLNGSWVGRIDAEGTRVLSESVLPLDLAREVMTDALSGGFNPGWYSGETWFSVDDGHLVARERRATGEQPSFVPSVEAIAEAPHKILCMAAKRSGRPALEAFGAHYADRCGVSFSDDVLLEVTASRVSKRDAVVAVAEMLGIGSHEVTAIGDSENDLGMIVWAGRGIAMGNAISQLRAIADWTTGSNQEAGLARAIDRVLADASPAVSQA